MALTFHQLRIFYEVAEKGSFSAAAQALHMTQPAVTMQVQALEDYFGVKLFRRSTKKVEITEAGKTLLPFAVRSVRLVQEAESAMSRFTRLMEGRLQFGASLTFGEYILPRLLVPFRQEHPNVTIRMRVMNTAQILEEILSNRLDFGLVEAPIDDPEVVTEAVLSDELKLVLPVGHPLAEKETITIEDVRQYPFVLREPGSGTRRVMEEELRRRGIDPGELQVAMELGSTGAIKSAVEAGIGLSILSKSSVRHEVALGLLKVRRIEGFEFTRHFYSVYRKTALLPMSAVAFLAFLRERDLSRWL